MRPIATSCVALAALLTATPATAQQALWSVSGELSDGDARGSDEGHRYDEHRIRLDAGQRYAITLDSEDFDPVARLYRAGSDEPVAENDDGGESLNSRIVYTPTESGDYVLRATSYSSDGRGTYTAGLQALPPLAPPITSPGQTVSSTGTWSLWQGVLSSANVDSDGAIYQDYLIRSEAGQVRYISLSSQDFDPVIMMLQVDQRDSAMPDLIDVDDDGGIGLNSFLVFSADQSGDYIRRVRSYGGGETGTYTLYVSQ